VRPVYSEDKISPCTHQCPIHQKIPAWLGLVAEEKFEEAFKVLREDNPMPGICGRVCHHPCESVCNRKDYDETVSINMIERFLGDFGASRNIAIEHPISQQNKTVAIVGSGPAGLSCAYHLAKKGYQAKVFEALSELGGMLRVIPPYRLPTRVLDREISWIEELGVEFLINTKIDKELLSRELREFDAVFIGTGAPTEETLDIPGEDLEGVFSGLEFLKLANANRKVRIGKKVMVVGGGNTAIDVGRSLWRKGFKPTILYRRTQEQMPAIQEEVEEALKEGVRIDYLVSPLRMIGKGGKLTKIECVRNKLVTSGRETRPKPVPIRGSNFTLEADTVILALGAHPDTGFAKDQVEVRGHYITVDEWGWTQSGAIYAGGDVTAGVGTVSGAIGTGKRAALAIDRFLRDGGILESSDAKQIVEFKDLNLDYFSHSRRAKRPQLSIESRLRGAREVNKGVASVTAVREAARCFSCGLCNQCGICLMVCPDVAIFKKDESFEIDYDYCKGCGICAVECPRSVITIESEDSLRSNTL
jgi:2-oxoacid:acceptor oxidoreductase delta subunit (pyruvate/2-ketoisovalerate family)